MVSDGEPSKLQVSVGVSTKKNAHEAGIEVAKITVSKLNSKPDLFLLFATADYETNGGFEEFLNGVWEVLPDETKLVGGVISGFVNSKGCYARGATAMAVSYQNMNIITSFGKKVKRNPKFAAKENIKIIKKELKNTYKNKFLLSLISGGETIKMPGVKDATNIKSKTTAKIILLMTTLMQKAFQKGLGTEEEVLKELTKELPEFYLLHGSTMNSVTYGTNYQFFGKSVLTESAVCLVLETDLNLNLESVNGAEKTNIEFKISSISKNKRIIKKINNRPALKEYIRLMDWTKESLEKEKWIDIVTRFPVSFYKDDKILIRTMGMTIGDYMGLFGKFENKKGFISKITPSSIASSIDELLKINNPEFGFFVSCIGHQGILGLKVFEIQEKLKNYFKDRPFLLIYSGGEGIKKPNENFYYLNETTNSAIFY